MTVGQSMAFGGKYQAEDVRLPAKDMGHGVTTNLHMSPKRYSN